mmetsp:Transcript_12739/g.44633  ORF Transcript_12739/g.44633 Transcript_12739/m.44633 type:complete len:209 (-) Transcript_12739:152-778(-)
MATVQLSDGITAAMSAAERSLSMLCERSSVRMPCPATSTLSPRRLYAHSASLRARACSLRMPAMRAPLRSLSSLRDRSTSESERERRTASEMAAKPRSPMRQRASDRRLSFSAPWMARLSFDSASGRKGRPRSSIAASFGECVMARPRAESSLLVAPLLAIGGPSGPARTIFFLAAKSRSASPSETVTARRPVSLGRIAHSALRSATL